MTLHRRDLLRWTLGSLPIVAFSGDEVLAMPERLPKVWPNGAFPQADFGGVLSPLRGLLPQDRHRPSGRDASRCRRNLPTATRLAIDRPAGRGVPPRVPCGGITKLVAPISTGPGSGGDAEALDYPINKTIIEATRAQGGISCEAHNLGPFGTSGVPANLIHGLSDCLDQLEPDHYYRFLNCGFKIGLGNGSGSDHPARVLGCCRVYVRISGTYSFAKWIDGLKRGRTFTTSDPLLFLTVNDTDIGTTLTLKAWDTVRIRARAVSLRALVRSRWYRTAKRSRA